MYKQIIQHIKKNEKSFPLSAQSDVVKINPEHGKRIAQAYHDMKHDPDHAEVKQAYDALINETKNQYNDLINSGIKISRIEPGMENPYKNSKELHADVKNNKHLWYFPTEHGFGDNEQSSKHPMLQSTGIKHGEKELLANDLFRIVHDINGHHLGGESGFGSTGEHKAYLTHKKMYSPLAGRALASETLGQNSWVNFGPHGEHNQKNPSKTIYAEQKAGLLPDEIINGNWHAMEDIKKTEKNYSDEELFQFFKEYAMKKAIEYKEKYPETPSEDLRKNFNKLLRNGIALLGLAQAHRYMDTPPDSQQIKDKLIPETSISQEANNDKQKKIDSFLKTTSTIESSGGKNLNHPKINYGIHAGDRAVGKWALMPNTVKEIAGRMVDNPEIAPYAKMNSKKISKELSHNPHHEKQMASFLANKLYDKFGGDENKMAYAWNQGHNIDPKSFETDRKNYLDHDYVKKYNKYKEENVPARGVAGSVNK
jgi:hypothetical protein